LFNFVVQVLSTTRFNAQQQVRDQATDPRHWDSTATVQQHRLLKGLATNPHLNEGIQGLAQRIGDETNLTQLGLRAKGANVSAQLNKWMYILAR
jgi:hypothetical protein